MTAVGDGSPPDRVLVLRALGLGDLLTAVPALRGLRRAFPAAALTLACPRVLEPLVRLTGAFDEVVDVPGLGALGHPEPVADLVVNLHGSGPQSIADALGTGAPTIWSHRHPAFPRLAGPAWDPDQHEVVRWCRLLQYFGVAANPDGLSLAVPATASPAPGAVVVHPGAASVARRWPPERFAAVARALSEKGEQVVVTGSAAEQDLASKVADLAGLPPDAVLAGGLGLDDLAALVARAGLLVCGDTGVAHLASAYATPSVVLFGPTPPAWWGPPASGPHVVLWAGRRGDPHGDRPDPGLLQISPPDVLASLPRRRVLPGSGGVSSGM
jgi:ADP-heptose:LPS heptosyltransferase